jgi:hypothetical protein
MAQHILLIKDDGMLALGRFVLVDEMRKLEAGILLARGCIILENSLA